jgi:DNA polymerase
VELVPQKKKNPSAIERRQAIRDAFVGYTQVPELEEVCRGLSLVMGNGNLRPAAILVGEAPGRREDELGRPFVGMSGRRLDAALEHHGIDREKLWVTNVVKARPDGNRTPDDEEILASVPFLWREIGILSFALPWTPPILALGRVAATALSDMAQIGVGAQRGSWLQRRSPFDGKWHPFLITYHPSALRSKSTTEQFYLDIGKLGARIAELVRV